MKTATPPIRAARRIILGILLVGLLALMAIHQFLPGTPAIDALDPFGGLETLLSLVAGGGLLKKIEPGTLVLLGGGILLSLVLSRFFCGWLCAFGALQGFFGWLGRKIFRRRLRVPPALDRVLRLAKYPILVLVLYFTWRTGTLVIRPYEPLPALAHLPAGIPAVWAEFAVGFVVLVAVLLLSMLYERVFCKYLCPLGAFYAIVGRLSRFRIARNPKTCVSCSKCDAACPMDIDVSRADAVGSPECIGCLECVTACPTRPVSLATRLFGKPLGLGASVLLGLGLWLGAAGLGAATGLLDFTAPTLAERAAGGVLRVEDIKGSSTWASIADSFGLELERLWRESGLGSVRPAPEAALRDTKNLPGLAEFEVDSVRLAVARILGLDYSGEAGEAVAPSAAPEPAASGTGLAPAGAARATEAAAGRAEPSSRPVATAAVPAAPAKAADTAPSAAPAPDSAKTPAPAPFVLEGSMTLAEAAAASGLGEAAILERLGLPADFPRDQSFRELKDRYGYTMPELKSRFGE